MYAVQLTLDDFSEPHNHRACARVRGGWKPPEHMRIPGVRFAPEVPREECHACSFNRCGHPLLPHPENENVCEKLCTKDCLAAGIPLIYHEISDYYEMEK